MIEFKKKKLISALLWSHEDLKKISPLVLNSPNPNFIKFLAVLKPLAKLFNFFLEIKGILEGVKIKLSG